jgi:hypothetical protein
MNGKWSKTITKTCFNKLHVMKYRINLNTKFLSIDINILHDFPQNFICPDLLVMVGATSYGTQGYFIKSQSSLFVY